MNDMILKFKVLHQTWYICQDPTNAPASAQLATDWHCLLVNFRWCYDDRDMDVSPHKKGFEPKTFAL